MAAQAGQIVGSIVAVPFGVSRFINELCERVGIPKSIIVDVSIGWNTFVCFILFIVACVMSSAGKYYTDPKAQGDGLDVLWSVDQGDSFSIVFPPLMIIICNIIALVCINLSLCNDLRYGIYLGITMCFVVQILQILVEWGSQAVMLSDLSKDADLSLQIGYPKDSHVSVSMTSLHTSQAMCVFGSFMFIFQIVQVIVLMIFKNAIVTEGGLCFSSAKGNQIDGMGAGGGDPFNNGGAAGGFVAQHNSDDL
jgi:hypothetical protein